MIIAWGGPTPPDRRPEAPLTQLPRTRLFVDAALAAQTPVPLGAAQAHHLKTVLRKNAGDGIRLFNGRDGEWLAEVSTLGRSDGQAMAQSLIREQTAPGRLRLLVPPIKRSRLEWLVEKATELGVAAIDLVVTDHTDAARPKPDRLVIHAIDAAQQCERLDVPVITGPRSLGAWLDDWPADQPLFVAAERCADTKPAADAMAKAARLAGSTPISVLVGPEGGLAPSELDALRVLPFVALIGLGPRILRTETAALTALACWHCVAGDGSARPPAADVSTESIGGSRRANS